MILILSHINDRHADQVETILQQNSASYSRLNLDLESLQAISIISDEDSVQISGPDFKFNSDEIDTVWNRSSNVEQFIDTTKVLFKDYQVWKDKCNQTLERLFSSLKSIKWLNLSNDFYLDNHFRQFTISKNVGLKWPSFICSNDINYLNSFFEKKKDRILKLMEQGCKIKAEQGCSFKCGDILDIARFEHFPDNKCLAVNAGCQVRCTVVGKEYFVGKIIEGSGDKVSEIQSDNTSVVQPPLAIKKRAIELMNELNLTYGVFDFFVTRNNEWYFDALNPVGSYQWIENMDGPDISLSIAKWLMSNN